MISTTAPASWTARLDRPLHARIEPLPPEARDFVHLVNQATGLAAVPEAVVPDARLHADLETALLGMPARVRELVAPLLLGVCIGRGLGSSGITDIVLDAADGRLLGCLVLLDLDLLAGHTANSWATWKDNLPFTCGSGGPGFTVGLDIADATHDTRANALRFLLLHEFGHVLTAGGAFLPRWWEPLASAPVRGRYPFLDLSWETTGQGRFAARPDCDFDLRGVVDFYGVNKLDGEALVCAYAGLETSGFASLYGATNPYDDFAECFATYVHSEVMGQPYVLRIDLDGEAQAWLTPFWHDARSAAKRMYMEALLEEPQEEVAPAARQMLACAA